MTWGQQKAFFGVIVVAVLFGMASAWDERDLAELREDAERAKENGVRYLVERSRYRDVYASAFHCRAPREGERLVMQHAHARDPGRGYRCMYHLTSLPARFEGDALVIWSRSPDVVATIPSGSVK